MLNVIPAVHGFDRRIFILFLALTCLSPRVSSADEPIRQIVPDDGRLLREGWYFVTERQGTRVYNRQRPGSPVPEALARTVIRVPPQRLYAVVTDYDHFAEFIPYVTSSRILREQGEIRYVHQHLRFPRPLADRYYTIASSARSRPRENFFRIEWHLVPESGVTAAGEAGVMPSAFSGFWELSPSENGTATDAVYSIHFDPGGALPSWLVAPAMNRYLPKVVEAVRAKALQPAAGDTQESNLPAVKQH